MPSITIPAYKSDYVNLKKGERLKMTNTYGNQVIDFWAFVFPDTQRNHNVPTGFVRNTAEGQDAKSSNDNQIQSYPLTTSGIQYFSASRTRSILAKLIPSALTQDILYTNKSIPLFTMIEDTTSGVHDTLYGCCDRFRYYNLGVGDYEHASCAENMHVALRRAAAQGIFASGSISEEWTPDPLNAFMNVPVLTALDRQSGGGTIQTKPPESRPGEYIVLRAEVDCLAVMSACPNDIIEAVNGGHCTSITYEVMPQ